MRDHVRNKRSAFLIISSSGSIYQDGGRLGVGFHRPAVHIIAGARADNRAGVGEDLGTQE